MIHETAEHEMTLCKCTIVMLNILALLAMAAGVTLSVIEEDKYWALCFLSGFFLQASQLIHSLIKDEGDERE